LNLQFTLSTTPTAATTYFFRHNISFTPLKQLEDENRKLKHVVAELTLDNRALKDVLSKNW